MRLPFCTIIIKAMEQREVKYSLGTISHIEPRTFGQPGRRTFNLVLEAGSAQCTVWLEKEQLFQLGVYLREAIESLSDEDRQRQGSEAEPAWSGENLTLDFKVGQMLLSHERESNSFRMTAYEREDEERSGDMASVSFWITVDQAGTVAEEALRICSAGRPTCFLCGQPINPDGHVCPRANGHTVLESG